LPPNQNPEQLARDRIDRQLALAGWVVQDNKAIDFNAGPGIAVREYRTDAGPADYVLFVNGQAAGVIEAKAEDQGHKLTTVEDQPLRQRQAQVGQQQHPAAPGLRSHRHHHPPHRQPRPQTPGPGNLQLPHPGRRGRTTQPARHPPRPPAKPAAPQSRWPARHPCPPKEDLFVETLTQNVNNSS